MHFKTIPETNRQSRWRVTAYQPSGVDHFTGPSTPIHLVTILYRSGESFPGFLRNMLAQDRPDWRLHIIDNGDPQSAAVAEALADPRISISRNPANLGFARAANQGMREALAEGARAVLLINNDVILPANLISGFGEAARQLPGAVLSPRIMDTPDVCGFAGGSIDKNWIFESVSRPYDPAVTEPQRSEFAWGCCLFVPAEVLNKVGFLDERFFVYWEDSDFCLRLNQAGVPIYYLPGISIHHKGRESTGGGFSPAYQKLFCISHMQFLKKHFGFGHALVTMLRLMRRDLERRNFVHFGVKMGAMLRGLLR
jgi:GT2 family glycosyltransferase